MFKQINKFLILLCFGIIIISFSYFLQFYFNFLKIDGPQELRESAIILNTDLILQGKNPYALENMPLFVNVYGPVYHYLVGPFVFLFNNSLLIHRLLSGFFILATASFFFLFLRKENVSTNLSLIATFIFCSQIIIGYELLARPDSLGLFLFLLAIFIPRFFNYRNKSLFFSLILTLIAFLTKPYFIFALLYLASYLFLFVSKKKGLIFAGSSFISLIALLLFLNYLYPTLILNVIFTHKAGAGRDFEHLYRQIYTFLIRNFSVLILFGIGAYYASKANFKIFFQTGLINLTNFSKPLLLKRLDIVFLAAFEAAILIYFKLGLHSGNFMTYFTHLLTPFMIFGSFLILSKFKLFRLIFFSLLVVFLNLLVLSFLIFISFPPLTNYQQSWQQWEDFLAPFQNVYNTPPLSLILSNQHKPFYDTGQSEFFVNGLVDNNKLHLVKNADVKYQAYVLDMKSKLAWKKFDLVVVTEYGLPFFSKEDLQRYYFLKEQKRILMFKDSVMTQIWYPLP